MNRGERTKIPTDRFNSFLSSQVKKEKPVTKLYLKRFHLHKENEGGSSRWKFYYDRIVDFLRIIEICESCKTDNGIEIILLCKLDILMCFDKILEENIDHIRWPILDVADANGEVDIEKSYCSVCKGDVIDDGNDIIFCDYQSCNRAYHKLCLDPCIPKKVNLEDFENDWFCWECETVDMSLNKINAVLKINILKVTDLFPEVKFVSSKQNENLNDDEMIDNSSISEMSRNVSSDQKEPKMTGKKRRQKKKKNVTGLKKLSKNSFSKTKTTGMRGITEKKIDAVVLKPSPPLSKLIRSEYKMTLNCSENEKDKEDN